MELLKVFLDFDCDAWRELKSEKLSKGVITLEIWTFLEIFSLPMKYLMKFDSTSCHTQRREEALEMKI